MNGTTAWVLSQGYTDDSIRGISGALAGKNCTVDDITKSGNENVVKFKWTADDGTVKTKDMRVKDGENVDISADTGNAIVTKADGLFVAKGAVEISAESENALVSKADGLYVSTTSLKLSDGTTIEDAIDSLKAGQDESASDVPPIDFDTDW